MKSCEVCAGFHLVYYLCICFLLTKYSLEMLCSKFWDVSFSFALEYLEVFAAAFICLCLFSFDQEADCSYGSKVLQTNV